MRATQCQRGGRLEITTNNVIVDADEARRVPTLSAGPFVVVRVSDTGSGMEPHVASRVFEPFFTTKEVDKGTGLGLSQVYGFVKQSGGNIVIDTAPGAGTTFRLYLPRSEAARPTCDSRDASLGAVATGHETVLVVEDNAEVLELAVTTISDLGYRVVAAPNGPAALDILRGSEPIDLLFSDVVMPGGINGFELIKRARALRGELKALVTSGYANVQRPGSDRPDVPLLLKPYQRADLARYIRTTLDQR
jgi:CheY-like chemotaxis protein